jgi:signal transduction histidine kinase
MFHYGLKQDGYLVLGEAESVGKFNYLFEPLTKKSVIFRKKQAQPTFEVRLEPSIPYSIRRSPGKPEKADSINMLETEIDKLLMAEYVPASLLLNNNLDVLVFRGKVNPYISIDSGVASLNAAKIVRKELRPTLQTAIYRAKKAKKDIKETVRLEQGKENRAVNIQVKTLTLPKHEEAFFFVLFSETTKEKFPTISKKSTTKAQKEVEGVKDQQIKELSEDLDSTKQTLQMIIEQQEATNEELRSAMEEVQSSNEELMSTNEELETSKEELQSTNEELTTLNEELKNRNQNLSVLNDDLSNLMVSVDTAVVIVDNNFKIRRFTSQAQELLRLMPTDVDHQIIDIRLGIPVEALEKSLHRAIANLELTRQEIKTEKGSWFQMRVRPYLTQDRKIGGAILSFSDVTELKKHEEEKQSHADILELRVKDQADMLMVSERLSAIGATAGMVGHDIRNPLQAISSDSYLIKSDLALLPESDAKEGIKESLAGIDKNIDYISKIVTDLQDYAKTIAPVAKEVDLGVLCRDVISKLVPQGIETICQFEKGTEILVSDSDLLKRILSNLVSNAVQAMHENGKLVIHSYKEASDVLISVQDTGDGIPDEIKPKLFTPLFTTKSKGQGFGLAVVKRMSDALGGTVTFESQEGKGTTFTIRLPQSPNKKL